MQSHTSRAVTQLLKASKEQELEIVAQFKHWDRFNMRQTVDELKA